jgi:hypothetical protein
MSIAILPLVDLTSAAVNTTGKVLFNNVGVSAGGVSAHPSTFQSRAHLNVFNDSKCSILFQTIQEGHSDHLTPGAWRTYDLMPGESGFQWTVEAVMNVAAPISQLTATFYFPGEPVDDPGVLGNSPIGGGVSTSSVQTLSNEGNSTGFKVVDIGTVANNDLLDIFTDSFLWKVLQSGVVHQVLKGQTSGNPLQLGQAGDTSEVLGSLVVDASLKTNTIRDNTSGIDLIDLAPTLITLNQALSLSASGIVNSGSVAGTITLFQFIQGNVKCTYVQQAAYNSLQKDIVLPQAYTNICFIFAGGIGVSPTGGLSLMKAGVAQNIAVITALATAGGTTSTVTVLNKYSIGENGTTGWDTLRMLTTGGVANSGGIFIIGV